MGLLEITKLPTAENAVIHLHPSDNIAIARVALSPGQELRVDKRAVTVEDAIPAGHKVALQAIGRRANYSLRPGYGPRADTHRAGTARSYSQCRF